MQREKDSNNLNSNNKNLIDLINNPEAEIDKINLSKLFNIK